MPLHNYSTGNILFPNTPIVTAYDAQITDAGGAYGLSSAAAVQTLINTVDAVVSALDTKKVISAS